jgi:uncharacterized membrane protein
MTASLTEPRGNALTFIHFRYLWAVAAAFVVMFGAMASDSYWALNFVHVMAGVLWTGIDLFMGFVLGPIQRRLDLPARRAIVARLMPRMLFLMPTLAIITGWAGTTLALRLGFFDFPYPEKGWVMAALAVLLILTVQGLFIMLPNNVRVCIEIAKDDPDLAMVSRRMRLYVRATALQGLMQVTMIVIMAKFVTGF